MISASSGGARRATACALTFALLISTPSIVALAYERAYGDSGSGAQNRVCGIQSSAELPKSSAVFGKTEVVYATLDGTGAPLAEYVVNLFEVQSAGRVVDLGPWSDVRPLSEGMDIARVGEAVVFDAEPGTYRYQGDVSTPALPWAFSLEFELDGKKVAAADLAGATGKLTMRIKTERNADVAADICESYVMQIMLAFPGDACSNVSAPGASLAWAGSDRTVAFTVLPGHDGEFTVCADVHDFHMPAGQIAALPYAAVIEMPRVDGLVEGLSQLAGGVSQLSTGAASFSCGMGEFGAGLSALDASSADLVAGSAKIRDALGLLDAGLSSFDPSSLQDLAGVPPLLRSLAASLEALASSTTTAYEDLDRAVVALDAAYAQEAPPVTDEQLGILRGEVTSPEGRAALDALAASDASGRAMRKAYSDQRGAIVAARDTVKIIADQDAQMLSTAQMLRSSAAAVDAFLASGGIDQIAGVVAGIHELSVSYGAFHDGLVSYTDGVHALAGSFGGLRAGAESLSSGASSLDAATSTLPDTVRNQMDSAMKEFDFPVFEPRSFMSERNESTVEVQFVIATPAIEKDEVAVEPAAEPELSLWDRFWALFANR